MRVYKASTYCHICEDELLNDKVADHCHLTGKFRGAAHNKCNLEYRIPKFFSVIFHNLAGYDAHLFVKNLGVTEGKINCIPKNEQKTVLKDYLKQHYPPRHSFYSELNESV